MTTRLVGQMITTEQIAFEQRVASDTWTFVFPDGHRVKGWLRLDSIDANLYVGAAEVHGATLRMGVWVRSAVEAQMRKPNPKDRFLLV